MRISRCTPLRLRRGFFIAATLLVVATAVGALPAGAASSTVPVTLRISAAEPATTAELATCTMTVADGADGITVLDAAVTAGCIDSYETQTYAGIGTFVRCIDGLCGAPDEALNLTYWRMTENGSLTAYGVDDFTAESGDELGFSYTTWATCLTSIGC